MMADSPSHSQPLTTEQVRKVAALAKLELADTEVERLRGELGAILGYAQRLQGLDLDGVEPLISPLEMTGPMAADEPGGTLPPQVLLSMAPATDGEFVKVPKVLGGSGGA